MRTSPRLLVAVAAGTVLFPGVALAKGGPKVDNHGQVVSAVARSGGDVREAAHRTPPTVRVPNTIDRCGARAAQLAQVEARIAGQTALVSSLESQLAAARAAGNTRLAARLTMSLTNARRSLIDLQAQAAKLRLGLPCITPTTVPGATSTTVPTVSLVPATTTTLAPTTTASPTTTVA